MDVARVGLTPVTLVQAARSIARMANRAGGKGRPVTVAYAAPEAADLLRKEVDAYIGFVCEIDGTRSAAVVGWVLDAAGTVTRLIPGYRARATPSRLLLVADPPEADDLRIAWSSDGEE